MGTLGKVLIFLNIVAAGAFIALATMSWGTRQPWSYAVLRYEVMIAGLPITNPPDGENPDPDVVNFGFQYREPIGRVRKTLSPTKADQSKLEDAYEIEVSPEAATFAYSPPVETISRKALNDIFQNAQGGELLGGPPVANQIAEVQRVRDAALKAIDSADGPDARRALLRSFLINQARNGNERERYNDLTANANDLDGARRQLEQLFSEALAPIAESTGTDKLNFPAKRRQIAHLLYHLSDKPEWHSRVLVVVGLQRYVETIDAQANELNGMVLRLKTAIADDQAKFEPKYQDLVQRCLFQQQELEKIQADLAVQKALIAGHEVIRNSRASEVQVLEADLKDAVARTKQSLIDQAAAEQTLFMIHQELKLSLDTIIQLEEQLRKVELLNTTSNR